MNELELKYSNEIKRILSLENVPFARRLEAISTVAFRFLSTEKEKAYEILSPDFRN
jgi:tRNA(His) 5'-end guanylyltransferase